jgi:hypothetical protein
MLFISNAFRILAKDRGNLLNRCRGQNSYRGFESPPLRQISPNCIQRRDLLTSYQKHFYIIRVLPSLSGCTVVAHIVSRDFIAFAASALTVFT